jgi:hypothetical protein
MDVRRKLSINLNIIHLHDVIKETDINNRGANNILDLNKRYSYKDIL